MMLNLRSIALITFALAHQTEYAQTFDLGPTLNFLLKNYHRSCTILDLINNNGLYYNNIPKQLDFTYVIIQPIFSTKITNGYLNSKNIILLEHLPTNSDIEQLSECEYFDVVLTPLNKNFKNLFNAFRMLGSFIIYVSDSPITQSIYYTISELTRKHSCYIFYHGTHAIIVGTKEKMLTRGWFRGNRKAYHIVANFREKYFLKTARLIPLSDRPYFIKNKITHLTVTWQKGINLWTYIMFNGIQPSKQFVEKRLGSIYYSAHYQSQHPDNNPWNFVIQGEKIIPIDATPNITYDPDKIIAHIKRTFFWLYNPPWQLKHIK